MPSTSRRFAPGKHACRTLIEVFQAHPDFLGFRVDTGELTAEVIELGGIVTRLEIPDRRGDVANVLLGCPTIADYLGPHPHFNCLVGRYANRMTNARFELDGMPCMSLTPICRPTTCTAGGPDSGCAGGQAPP